jgi:hypothetical protein
MKKSSDTIGNRTRDLPVCSAVPQPLRHRLPATNKKDKLKIPQTKLLLVVKSKTTLIFIIKTTTATTTTKRQRHLEKFALRVFLSRNISSLKSSAHSQYSRILVVCGVMIMSQ